MRLEDPAEVAVEAVFCLFLRNSSRKRKGLFTLNPNSYKMCWGRTGALRLVEKQARLRLAAAVADSQQTNKSVRAFVL